MAKPGRNDRCPCGSGKKYKACCLTKDETAEREKLAADQAAREARAAEKRLSLRRLRAAMTAELAAAVPPDDSFDHELAQASYAALDLFHDGRLDEAEIAARDLQLRYPDMPDGWEYLGLIHEKRGENAQAAECYRNALERVRRSPEEYEPAFEQQFVDMIARLDPQGAK